MLMATFKDWLAICQNKVPKVPRPGVNIPPVTIKFDKTQDDIRKVTMTILGMGTDILHISRIQKLLLPTIPINKSSSVSPFNNPKAIRFTSRILHPVHELPHYKSLISTSATPHQDIIRYVAGIWSVKESIYKSLDPSLQSQYGGFKQWWKFNDHKGRPVIGGEYLDMVAAEHGSDKEKFWCSVSHDGDVLVSQVVWSRES
ncbi:hypothetical protein WICPIJ_003077 [Wickerhamomyces pijperi]|uniref:4'-phosphopantetheinyl transferase domain-containing protein n=1 Tax=Wickerhamomyces pijperi TaxID=599730 RepID=A0A9P8TP81_WICPI|nr:hypothetical protein WICPIJ_003077 [Wickerhamomyces pijperi]